MNLGKSSDYILSFQVKGIPFLMSDLFARSYDGVDVLDIWKDGDLVEIDAQTGTIRRAT